MAGMSVRKMSVALDEEVAAAAAEAADRAGLSLSAWLNRAASRSLTIEAGLEAVREWERDYGALTSSELAAADDVLDGLLGTPVRSAG
jgi:hypothetical protein